MILFADCSSSTRGMFLGLILLVLTVIGCIIVMVIMDDCNYKTVIHITLIYEVLLFTLLILASLQLYYKIVKFDVNLNPISFLDDMLLIVCLPSFFLFGVIQLGAAVMSVNGKVNKLSSSMSSLFHLVVIRADTAITSHFPPKSIKGRRIY